jgi:hypothetical protein
MIAGLLTFWGSLPGKRPEQRSVEFLAGTHP